MTCVSQGTTNYDVDGDRDNDYCYEREWWDCNTDSQCPSNKWCTGSGGSPRYDCVPDLGLCSACSRSNQCQSGTTCISGKCRIAATETGLCSNNIDDDCDGVTDCQGKPANQNVTAVGMKTVSVALVVMTALEHYTVILLMQLIIAVKQEITGMELNA